MKTQKKLLLFFLSLGIVVACKEEDEERKYDLQGIWTLSRTVVEECVDQELNETDICTENCSEIVITETQIIDNNVPTFTYRISNNQTILLQRIGQEEEIQVIFLLSDNRLVLIWQNQEGEECTTTKIYRR